MEMSFEEPAPVPQGPASVRTQARSADEQARIEAVERSRREAQLEKERLKELRRQREEQQTLSPPPPDPPAQPAPAPAPAPEQPTPPPVRHQRVSEEDMRAFREHFRDQLLKKLEPFMPQSHELKPGLDRRLPNAAAKVATPRQPCNRYCSRGCVSRATVGFLKALRESVPEESNPSLERLKRKIKLVAARYHPDKQREDVVGAQKSARAQEACQIATNMLNLLEEVEYGTIVVLQAAPADVRRPLDSGAKIRLNGVHERDSILMLKERVVEEEPSLGPPGRVALYVAGANAPLDDAAGCEASGVTDLAVLHAVVTDGDSATAPAGWAAF